MHRCYMFNTPECFIQARSHQLRIREAALDELQASLREREAALERERPALAEGGRYARYLGMKALHESIQAAQTGEPALWGKFLTKMMADVGREREEQHHAREDDIGPDSPEEEDAPVQ